jgi:hypothetical protein
MSTRCQIGIYRAREKGFGEWEALIYKHCDGYPEGVLPIIKPFLERFSKERGLTNTEYVAAWLLHELIATHTNDGIKHAKEWGSPGMPEDGKDWLGHGICKIMHTDIEYFYKIYPCAIEVFKANIPWEEGADVYEKSNFTLIDTIGLA